MFVDRRVNLVGRREVGDPFVRFVALFLVFIPLHHPTGDRSHGCARRRRDGMILNLAIVRSSVTRMSTTVMMMGITVHAKLDAGAFRSICGQVVALVGGPCRGCGIFNVHRRANPSLTMRKMPVQMSSTTPEASLMSCAPAARAGRTCGDGAQRFRGGGGGGSSEQGERPSRALPSRPQICGPRARGKNRGKKRRSSHWKGGITGLTPEFQS